MVDRETVWSKMVQERRREDGQLRVESADGPMSMYEKAHGSLIQTPVGSFRLPAWLSGKGIIVLVALGVLVGIVVGQPLEKVEESNCLGMLLFCTILWATEVGPSALAAVKPAALCAHATWLFRPFRSSRRALLCRSSSSLCG